MDAAWGDDEAYREVPVENWEVMIVVQAAAEVQAQAQANQVDVEEYAHRVEHASSSLPFLSRQAISP